jgi:hypothetical protein
MSDDDSTSLSSKEQLDKTRAQDRSDAEFPECGKEEARMRVFAASWSPERVLNALELKEQGDWTEVDEIVKCEGGKDYLLKHHSGKCACWILYGRNSHPGLCWICLDKKLEGVHWGMQA